MDKLQFAEMVSHPESFSSQDRGWLHAMEAKYPFSSPLRVLALMADCAHKFDTPLSRRRAALSMCNNEKLDYLTAKASVKEEEHPIDIFSEINTFQEPSFKTAPKSVILSNFLASGPSNAVGQKDVQQTTASHDDKNSIRADESLATETLAVILEKQGKYDRAIAIYRKLLATIPEKNSIFAAKILQLEELISNKKTNI